VAKITDVPGFWSAWLHAEPIVEILEPGKEKVTYINMTPEKAEEVYKEHLLSGHVVQNYTLASADIK